MITKDLVKQVFKDILKQSQFGYKTLFNEFSYLRFDIINNGKRYDKEINDDEFYGEDSNNFDDEYVSNGSLNYFPLMIIDDITKLNNRLFVYVNLCFNKYNDVFMNTLNEHSIDELITLIIMSLFSNATYEDYENPVTFVEKYITFILDSSLNYNNYLIADNVDILLNSNIQCSKKIDKFGYETPYIFNIKLTKDSYDYNLPIINYGIKDDVCYIYSIQNKVKNDDNNYTKKIKRLLNKVNENISLEDIGYDTIKDIAPSFVFTLNIFMNILKNNGISKIRVITFMPDRYFEKESFDREYADEIQNHITNKLILLFYRMKAHYNEIDINYPLYDLYYNGIDIPGNDLFVDISNKDTCKNNKLLNIVDEKILDQKIAKKF